MGGVLWVELRTGFKSGYDLSSLLVPLGTRLWDTG